MNLHTKDLSDDFFEVVIQVAKNLGTDPLWILQVCMAESGVTSSARNSGSTGSGLIQWMSPYWKDTFGLTRDQFTSMSAEQQAEKYLESYFRPYKGRLVNVTAVYCAVFLPVMLQHALEPNFVVAAPQGPFGWVYNANRGLDADSKGYIVIDDLRQAVLRHCRGPRWQEIEQRLKQTLSEAPSQNFSNKTLAEVQQKLKDLGYNLRVDGVDGPETRGIIKLFQMSKNLTPDGIAGPLTKSELFK